MMDANVKMDFMIIVPLLVKFVIINVVLVKLINLIVSHVLL